MLVYSEPNCSSFMVAVVLVPPKPVTVGGLKVMIFSTVSLRGPPVVPMTRTLPPTGTLADTTELTTSPK